MTCPNCGRILEENEKKCINCGFEISDEQLTNIEESNEYVEENYQNVEDEPITYMSDNENTSYVNENDNDGEDVDYEDEEDNIIPENINTNDELSDKIDFEIQDLGYEPIENNQITEINQNEIESEKLNIEPENEIKIIEPKENPQPETFEEDLKIENTSFTPLISTKPETEEDHKKLLEEINEKEEEELSHQLNNPKESKKGLVVVLIIIILIVIAALVYIGFFMNKDNEKSNEDKTTTTTTTTVVSNNPVENDQTIKIVDKYYKLPGTYNAVTQKNNTSFIINDNKNKIEFDLIQNNSQVTYATLKNDLISFQNTIKNLYENTMVVSTPKIETINGMELIMTRISDGNKNGIYFACNTMYDAFITGIIINKDNNVDEKNIEDFVQIFYNETTSIKDQTQEQIVYNTTFKKYELNF